MINLTGKIKYTELNPLKSKDPLRYQIKLIIPYNSTNKFIKGAKPENDLVKYYLELSRKELLGSENPLRDLYYDPKKKKLVWDQKDLKGIKTLDLPGWSPHITVNWKDVPSNLENWGLANGQNITVQVNPEEIIRDSKDYLFMKVYSKDLERLRVALGLTPKPTNYKHGFHLTIGLINQVEMQQRRTKMNQRKKNLK